LLTIKDFKAFSKAHTDVKTTLCDVTLAQWEEKEDMLVFTISANRFLRNMVRAVVGTLLEVGRGKLSMEGFKEVVNSLERSEAGDSAPAEGLYLSKIIYPQSVFKT
jgi:tRNA pseudouridine38-40 synthase